eukprot:803863-Amphidinium_carterae.1
MLGTRRSPHPLSQGKWKAIKSKYPKIDLKLCGREGQKRYQFPITFDGFGSHHSKDSCDG